jgi:phosphate acetyltransferase
MISYSSDSAASDEEVEKVREATLLAQQPSTTC